MLRSSFNEMKRHGCYGYEEKKVVQAKTVELLKASRYGIEQIMKLLYSTSSSSNKPMLIKNNDYYNNSIELLKKIQNLMKSSTLTHVENKELKKKTYEFKEAKD